MQLPFYELTPVSAVGSVTCCPPHCKGQVCSNSRSLIRKLVTDLSLFVDRLKDLTRTEQRGSYRPPESSHPKFEESLQWALDLVHESNLRLQEHVEQRSSRSPRSQTPPDDSPNMRRSQHYLEEREEQSPPTRHHPLHQDYGQFLRSNAPSEDLRRNPYGMVATIVGNSPHQTTMPSGNVYIPPQSPPIQAPQSIHSKLLPSPSSLNFSSSQSLPSMTPPITTAHPSAHSTLLQDLQHQVTVKTLEFRTLQREYDNLLQKLERQKTKCATLEKKFEVTDVEINTLTDEKEKLQAQVATMEGQVEELQQSRDEARRQLIANGAQYMRIMEMANRLQTQSAEDKKKWEAEKTELEQRIRVLEEAMVTGAEHRTPTPAAPGTDTPAASSSQTETINVLRAEVGRLRSRTQTLESAVQTMRRESISIQTAARQLVDSSDKIEEVALRTS
ncbi:uncharacterized protein SETTUDRAFT_35341 [Exserohilum turcica Et28A]|uniref:Uncharacterized protein n=1 Tax=Exserohilum turcicum (strain 28A) TaxID=671987 RepID=R0JJL2_EXST2|nr:uncharacterized protein SETTUDRAFT_35341 [Exserohilum turcica Et28A]EOA81508.1 hypothetical protein SETTUDRAFT_35341 [Exserohilum turcica Et28A]